MELVWLVEGTAEVEDGEERQAITTEHSPVHDSKCGCLDQGVSFKLVQLTNWKVVFPQTRDMMERCMATCGKAAGARAMRISRTRKEASAQEVQGYYKQLTEAKHLEYKPWVDNEVFDLIDTRKITPKNHVTGRMVLTIKTDKQGKFLKAKAK